MSARPLNESIRISRADSPNEYQTVTKSQLELTTPLGNEKVALSKSGNNMYVGGSRGLHIYNRKKGTQEYNCYKADDNGTKKIFSIFPTNSRHVVTQEVKTNDLVVLDRIGNEVMRIGGKQRCGFGKLQSKFFKKLILNQEQITLDLPPLQK